MNKSTARVLGVVLAVCAVVGLASGAAGQVRSSGNRSTKAAQPAGGGVKKKEGTGAAGQSGGATSTVRFADEPFHLDDVGLTMRLPEGAVVESNRIGDKQAVKVVPRSGAWAMTITTPVSSNPSATIAEAAEQSIKLLQGSVGVMDPDQKIVLDTEATLLERATGLEIRGVPGERFYVGVPRADGERLVKGYTILKALPTRFVVFELVTTAERFAAARPEYETVLATVSLEDAEAVGLTRAALVKTGAGFLASLSSGDFEGAIGDGKERWTRLYLPSSTGAPSDEEEFGYRGVRMWKGQRGEITPERPKSRWEKQDRQAGYLVSVRGRFIVDGPGGGAARAASAGLVEGVRVGDSTGVYFLSEDRTEEAWSVRTVVREAGGGGKALASATETGARSGKELVVSIDRSGEPTDQSKPVVPDEGYVSQVETYLLPRLLALKRAQVEMGLYAYQSQSRRVSLRKDTVNRQSARTGESKESAGWRISTRYRDEPDPQVTILNGQGELVRTELPDGRVWEPVDLERLRRVWEQKGLPVER